MFQRSASRRVQQPRQFGVGQRPCSSSSFRFFVQLCHSIERIGQQTLFTVEMRLLSVDSFADAPIAECEPGFTIAVVNRGPHFAFAGALFAQPAF